METVLPSSQNTRPLREGEVLSLKNTETLKFINYEQSLNADPSQLAIISSNVDTAFVFSLPCV